MSFSESSLKLHSAILHSQFYNILESSHIGKIYFKHLYLVIVMMKANYLAKLV